MRLLLLSPLAAFTYFSCHVNTLDSSSYLVVHVYSETGNLAGVSTEVWRASEGTNILLFSQKTGSDGLTTYELPPGTSEVRVQSLSESGASQDHLTEVVNLRAGETKRLEFYHCMACDQ